MGLGWCALCSQGSANYEQCVGMATPHLMTIHWLCLASIILE